MKQKRRIIFEIFLLSLLIIFHLGLSIVVAIKNPPLSEEIEMQKIANEIKYGKFNFKYSFYPFLLAFIPRNGEIDSQIFASRILSSLTGCFSIILLFILTKNIFTTLFVSTQLFHIYISSWAKADIFVFLFTMIAVFCIVKIYEMRGNQGEGKKESKYVIISAISSAFCIIFKYYFQVALGSFLTAIIISENKREIIKKYLMFFALPLLILYLTFFAIQPDNFIQSIKEQYALQKHYKLLGEKNISSIIFSISSALTSQSLYSVFSMPFIFLSILYLRKKATPYMLFFIFSSVSLYISSSHTFPHYYYPVSVPLSMLLGEFFRNEKKWFIPFLCVIAISIVKTKDVNQKLIDEMKKEISFGKNETRESEVERGRKGIGDILIIIPREHQFLQFLISHNLDLEMKVDAFIYDMNLGLSYDQKNGIVLKKIEEDDFRRYSYIIIDKSKLGDIGKNAEEEKIKPYHQSDKDKIEEIEKNIEDFCEKIRRYNSFEIINLDSFEKMLFPFFKNLLFYIDLEIWKCGS